MKPIIEVENISKQYRIGAVATPSRNLRETLVGAVKGPFERLRGLARSEGESVWALDAISFDLQPGAVVGLIGRNGAGKSTLLKILSRVTEPTRGRIKLYGRVGSLLEVGTGFHPDLTGRENVYLNGAILGMSRAEITSKFDAIVAFAEIEKFIDTPVKHYSSGMYVRLAFAVAAHLEPEILIIDEVLSVGDLSFQQKCLKHMGRLRMNGTTTLLVSHNMTAVQSICERVIYLKDGRMAAIGDPLEVIEQFRTEMRLKDRETATSDPAGPAVASSGVSIVGFDMFGADGTSRRNFRFGEEVRIRIDIHANRRIESPLINFGIKRGDGVIVCNFNNWYDNFKIDYIEGDCSLEGWLPPLRLIPHFYEIHVLVWQRESGYAQGDLSRMTPLAYKYFEEFTIQGPPLTDQDGVFQEPSKKWVLSSNGRQIEYDNITTDSLLKAFNGKSS